MVEQRHQGSVDLGAALQDPRGFVEHLQAFVLFALGHVGSVGDEHRDDRHGEQQRRGRLDEQHGDEEKGKTRVRQRHDRTHDQHPWDWGVVRGPLGQRDRGGHGEHPDHVLGGSRQEGRRPVARPEGPGDADEQVDDTDRDHRAEQELGEVEAELDRPLPPADDQRQSGADQASNDVLGGCEEEDPVHDGDLAHRERVGASADVKVDDLGFGHIEERGQEPPRERNRGLGRLAGRQLHRCEDNRNDAQNDGQRPDTRCTRGR